MLESLNPYEYQQLTEKDFRFTNTADTYYQVYFSDGSNYFEHRSFSNFVGVFGFKPLSNTNFTYDLRTAQTVIFILSEYLSQGNNIILFVCDEKDSRQANRNRLFNRWFQKYNDGSFDKFDLVFEENTFVSAVLSKNNPFYVDFTQTFPSLGEEYK